MKCKPGLCISTLLLTIALLLPMVNAAMPQGPNGPEDPFSKKPWSEDGSSQTDIERGYTFRYARGEPRVGMCPEGLMDGLTFHVGSITLMNESGPWELKIDIDDWTLQESSGVYRYSYQGALMGNDDKMGDTVAVEVEFTTEEIEGKTRLHYLLRLEGMGKGELRIGLLYALEAQDGPTFSDGPNSGSGGDGAQMISFRNREGAEIGGAYWDDTATAVDGENTTSLPVEAIGDVQESEAVLDLSMQMTGDTDSIETGGQLEFFSGFIEAFGSAAEEITDFLMDHLYSIMIGGAVMIALVVLAVSLLGRKGNRDDSEGLDLEKNRYYRRP